MKVIRSSSILIPASLLITLTSSKQQSKPLHPNVLFIGIDDLNDWIGQWEGHQQSITPNMDKLCTQGISFKNAHSNCTASQPSRNSLLSGLKPASTSWYSNTWDTVQKKKIYRHCQSISTAMPEYFRNNGYLTYGAGKIYHSGVVEFKEDIDKFWDEVSPPYTVNSYFKDSIGHGYSEKGEDFYHPFPPGGSPIIRKYGDTISGYSLCGGALNREQDIPNGIMHDEQITNWAINKLKEKHNKPFFLAVGYVRPHVPYTAPEEYFELFNKLKIQIPEFPSDDLKDIPLYGKAMIPGIISGGDHPMVLKMGEEYWYDLVKAYLACIAFVDNEVGKLLEALHESNYAKNTIVVLWSDHGQHLGEKKHWRKMALWEESTRVPLIFKIPSLKTNGISCNRPVGLVDIYPTLVELCNLPENSHLQGRSLKPLIDNPEITWDYPVISHWMYNNIAVRTQNYRYIQYRDGGEELYDHRNDPNEWKNLANNPDYKEIISQHKALIPDDCKNPFLQDTVMPDKLDKTIKEWEEEGYPEWIFE